MTCSHWDQGIPPAMKQVHCLQEQAHKSRFYQKAKEVQNQRKNQVTVFYLLLNVNPHHLHHRDHVISAIIVPVKAHVIPTRAHVIQVTPIRRVEGN